MQKKAEIPYFSDQKFFTPLTSFLPPFSGSVKLHKITFATAEFVNFRVKRGGKMFLLRNMESQLSFAPKINKKSLKLANITGFEI